MAHCKLKESLGMLKESSRSAVVDGVNDIFDAAKQYLHLRRPIEIELRKMLHQVASSPGGQLVLLCGNVGDGKSHLIAHLRETDPELLSNFTIHNDATESSRWDATNIDELRRVFSPYSNENAGSGSIKTLVAINLGTLSNFILAEGDNGFSRLREYVERMKILEVGIFASSGFDKASPYQFVSFCDHGLFDITAQGPVSDLVEGALAKVVATDDANPFHSAFCQDCGHVATKCPIRANFELLRRQGIRSRLSSLLIECIVKHHQIVSVRALYNFIHDVLVPPALDVMGADAVCDSVKKMPAVELLSHSLINAPFDHPEGSTILRHLHHLDPALRRTAAIDEKVIALMVSETPQVFLSELNPPESIMRAFGDTEISASVQVNTFVRSHYFFGEDVECFADPVYLEFMGLLFAWHNGDKQAIKDAFRLIGEATLAWHGAASKGIMLVELGNPQLEYRLSQRVDIKPLMPQLPQENSERLCRFSLALPFRFALGRGTQTETFLVDYRLYEISRRVVEGYRPNHADHSSFVTFSSFVERVAESGEMNERLLVTEAATGKQFVLELDQFGEFCFEEGGR